MNGNMKWLTPFVALAAMVASMSEARATTLSPGGNVTPGSTAAAGTLTVKADTGWLNFTTPGQTVGQVREVVVSGDTNNTFGGLDFLYQVKTTSGDGIGRVASIDFSGFKTDVAQVASQSGLTNYFGTGSVSASDATRSKFAGRTVSFDFATPNTVDPGTSSYVLIVRTNATKVYSGTIGVTDGGTANLKGFSPNPEPASLVLMGACFAGMGGVCAWRRRRKSALAVS